jgi:hypothetical protein
MAGKHSEGNGSGRRRREGERWEDKTGKMKKVCSEKF